MRRVLVTGSRIWSDYVAVRDALLEQMEVDPELVIVHGDCPRGADALADRFFREAVAGGAQVAIERHPADWNGHGKSAGFIRNQQMVNAGADICLAFPLGRSPGTRHCMKAAERAGIPVINYGERDQ